MHQCIISKCVVRSDVFSIPKQMQQIMPRDSTRNQTLKAIKPQPKIYETWYSSERLFKGIHFVCCHWLTTLISTNMNAKVAYITWKVFTSMNEKILCYDWSLKNTTFFGIVKVVIHTNNIFFDHISSLFYVKLP